MVRDELDLGVQLRHVDAADVQVIVAERPFLGVRCGRRGSDRGANRDKRWPPQGPKQFSSIHVSDSQWHGKTVAVATRKWHGATTVKYHLIGED